MIGETLEQLETGEDTKHAPMRLLHGKSTGKPDRCRHSTAVLRVAVYSSLDGLIPKEMRYGIYITAYRLKTKRFGI